MSPGPLALETATQDTGQMRIHEIAISVQALVARSQEPWWRASLLAFDLAAFKPDPGDKVVVNGARIRCPHCKWQPEYRSTWTCTPMGPPENFTGGCFHSWNTFDTAGVCPGCSHHWRHTTCLSCGQTSPHKDWYDTGGGAGRRRR